jgi:transglutaminase-like putative cysteine protease
MRYSIRHVTRYAYGAPVDLGYHLLRLVPPTLPRQRLVEHAIAITPKPERRDTFVDHFGNLVHHIAVEKRHEAFAAELSAIVEVNAAAGALPDGPSWDAVAASIRNDGFPAEWAVAEFACPSPLAPDDAAAGAYCAQSLTPGRPIVAALREFMRRINRDFAYVPGATTVATPVAEVMRERRGVCQDFAHVLIAGLRAHGLPARYVSGYIRTHAPPGEPERRGGDASHAWAAIWCGAELGWVELDPTNDLVVSAEHIVLAYGRDFSDVSPLRGVILGGGMHAAEVAVTVAAADRVQP